MSAYEAPVDIMNRALQILELPRIASPTDFSAQALELNFVYDKMRRQMLRRHIWTYATRRVVLRPCASTTMLIQPATWTAGSYPGGSIVSYQSVIYIATEESVSGTPGVQGSGWEPYFGPLTVTPWNVPSPQPTINQVTDQNPYLPIISPGTGNTPYGAGQGTVGYWTGELVYLPKGDGTYLLFRATITTANVAPAVPTTSTALAQPNSPDGPLLADPWDAATTYASGQLAAYPPSGLWTTGISQPDDETVLGPQVYQSTCDMNVGNEPDLVESGAALTWSATNAYSSGDHAWGSDNQVYVCTAPNTGQNPVDDTLYVYWQPLTMWVGTWTQTVTPSPRAFSNGWQYIPGSVTNQQINYPITTGPAEWLQTLNAYKLPANHLRTAPSDPTGGGIGWLGAPAGGIWFDDDVQENGFIVSQDIQPKLYRFVADITDVTLMDDLFTEALAALCAKAVQPLLQPKRNDLWQRAHQTYIDAIAQAAQINAIEMGSVEPPVDTLITCRI